MCRSTAECGVIGRSQLCTSARAGTPGAFTGDCSSGGMGVHFVNSTTRPYITAPDKNALSVEELEAAFTSKFSAAVKDRNADEAFLDFTYVVYSMDLGRYISDFNTNGVKYLPLEWPADTRAEKAKGSMFSVLVQVPDTQVIFEIVTGPYSGTWPEAPTGGWLSVDYTRVPTAAITGNNAWYADKSVLTPVAVSKATSDMGAIDAYYTDILGATASFKATSTKSTDMKLTHYTLPSAAVRIRFVERAATKTTGDLTVKEWETKKMAAHKQLRTGNLCGFNKWYDNHYAWDQGPGAQNQISLNTMSAKWDAQGFPYKMWLQPKNIYASDPTGDTIQVDASWDTCTGNCSLTKYNALGNNCVIGVCSQDTTTSCTDKVKALCPFGSTTGYPAIEQCMDCAIPALKSLESQGCPNVIADVSYWCIEQWFSSSAAALRGSGSKKNPKVALAATTAQVA